MLSLIFKLGINCVFGVSIWELYNKSLKFRNSFYTLNFQICIRINNNLKIKNYAEFKRD